VISKAEDNQSVKRRLPQQGRAREKIALILEAATRLIEQRDIKSLTTNAIALKAGVSIGTLYQYFADKDAILRALVDHEMAGIAKRVSEELHSPPPTVRGERVRRVMRAVLGSYGGRHRAHQLLLEYSLSRGTTGQLAPFFAALVEILSTQGVTRPGGGKKVLSEADAFVLTHAIAGVLRGFVASAAGRVSTRNIETSLARLVVGFVEEA